MAFLYSLCFVVQIIRIRGSWDSILLRQSSSRCLARTWNPDEMGGCLFDACVDTSRTYTYRAENPSRITVFSAKSTSFQRAYIMQIDGRTRTPTGSWYCRDGR